MSECFASLQVCGIRVARLDAAGVGIPGAASGYISDAMISVDVGLEVTTGDDLEVKNGCGSLCAAFKDCDRLKRVTLGMSLCQLDTELIEILTGASTFTDSGEVIGLQLPSTTADCPVGASFEVWTKAWDGGEQGVATSVGGATYFHFVFPRTKWRVGNFTLENKFLEVKLEGFGEENSQITSNGPYNDWPTGVVNGGGVTHIGGWFYDDAPPTASCGYVTVPSGS
jgi:hypothetical protein